MRVLVTGGCGFLGAHVVRELVEHGHDVVIADARPSTENLRIAWGGDPPSLPTERVDITDALAVLRVLRAHRIENVVHLAYMLTRAAAADPLAAIRVNLEGHASLLDLARALPLRRVVWASSGAVYARSFQPDKPLDDRAPTRPADFYGHCKYFNEFLGDYYFREFGVDSIGLRPFIVYGLGKPSGMTLDLLRELVVNPVLGRPGVVPFPRDVIPWLDVEEAAKGFRVAVEHEGPTPSRMYNFRGDPVSVATMMDYMRELVPGAQLTSGTGRAWGGKYEAYADDFGDAMQTDLGFQAGRSARQQLERAIERINAARPLIEELFPA